MQTANYTVNSGSGVALWRGIPAQIEVSGIADVSGNWIFIADCDWYDGVILSGTVAANGGSLTVTIAEMNTVELAEAIQGRSILQCRATLTDGVSRVYILPLTIKNRAISGTPTPVSEYYTKAQIDAMIAAIPTGTDDYTELDNKPAINGHTLTGDQAAAELGLATPEQIPPAQVQADWNEADTASKAYIQNKPVIPSVPVTSVNGKTGDVGLDAADVGAISKDGLPIIVLESATIPAPGAVYTFTPDAAAEFAFPTPVAGKDNAFRLVLTMPDPAVAVTFPAGLTWKFTTPALAAGTTSELAFAWNGASWEGWATPDMSEYALNYDALHKSETLTVPLSTSQNIIYIRNNGTNILRYYTASNQGIIQIGEVNSNSVFYTRIKGRYTELSADMKLSTSSPVVTLNKSNNKLALNIGNNNIYDASVSEDFTLPANLSIAGDLTFTPAGASEATTLSALIARTEALEAALAAQN